MVEEIWGSVVGVVEMEVGVLVVEKMGAVETVTVAAEGDQRDRSSENPAHPNTLHSHLCQSFLPYRKPPLPTLWIKR